VSKTLLFIGLNEYLARTAQKGLHLQTSGMYCFLDMSKISQ